VRTFAEAEPKVVGLQRGPSAVEMEGEGAEAGVAVAAGPVGVAGEVDVAVAGRELIDDGG
jgi:hypothetical protein